MGRTASPLAATRRFAGAGVALACLALLSVAAALNADNRGHGTHEQLGLPPCGWVIAFDAPCPTCGMTTSFSHAAGGNPVSAIVNQPLGGMLAVFVAMAAIGGLHVAITGVDMTPLLRPLRRGVWLWVLGASILGSWIYKIATWS